MASGAYEDSQMDAFSEVAVRDVKRKMQIEGTRSSASTSTGMHTAGVASQAEETTYPEHASFALRHDNAKLLFSVISSIHNLKKDQLAVMTANVKGLRVSTENTAKSMYTVAYINRELFSSFEVSEHNGEPMEVALKVNVMLLLECLLVYGANALPTTSVDMSYDTGTGMLSLLLEDRGVVTEARIRTIDVTAGLGGPDAGPDYEGAFLRHEVISKAVMSSDALHDAVRELAEQEQASGVSVTMSPAAPHFRLHTAGGAGTLTIDVPSTSEVFLSFDSKYEQTFMYPLPLLEASLRVLSEASQSFLRINKAGMLALTHKLLVTADGVESRAAFVTFTIMPEESMVEGDSDVTGGGAGASQSQACTQTGIGGDAGSHRFATTSFAAERTSGRYAGEEEQEQEEQEEQEYTTTARGRNRVSKYLDRSAPDADVTAGGSSGGGAGAGAGGNRRDTSFISITPRPELQDSRLDMLSGHKRGRHNEG